MLTRMLPVRVLVWSISQDQTLLPSTETLLKPQVPDTEEQQRLLRAPTAAETSAIVQQDRKRSAEVSDRRRGSYETDKESRAHMAQGDSNAKRWMTDRTWFETPEGGTYRRKRYHLSRAPEADQRGCSAQASRTSGCSTGRQTRVCSVLDASHCSSSYGSQLKAYPKQTNTVVPKRLCV